ncbi:MAG TPA: PorT family protein, partial [Bacteroidia bacterium]|nr:PorT family protein [Bacteroidia bacterium]
VLGGVKYSIDMVSQAKVKAKDKEYVKLQRNDYGYEIGVGCDFYLPMFKFSPEIKMYHGLRNLLVKDDLVYSKSLDGLFSKMFTLSLTFE